MNSALQQNMTILLNNMIASGTPISDKADTIDAVLNMSYNSFNDTLYVETKDSYYVIEGKNAVFSVFTEFEKTDDQKRFNRGGFE